MKRLGALLQAIWPDDEDVQKPSVFISFWIRGRSWRPLGGFVERLKASWRRLEASRSALQPSWRRLVAYEVSERRLEAS